MKIEVLQDSLRNDYFLIILKLSQGRMPCTDKLCLSNYHFILIVSSSKLENKDILEFDLVNRFSNFNPEA